MKRAIMALCCVALCCVTLCCDPPGNSGVWKIRNGTDQLLKFKCFLCMNYDPSYGIISVPPGESVLLCRTAFLLKARIEFDYYFSKCGLYWQILSEDEVVLRTWDYSDIGLPDQRFFEESEWYFEQNPGQSGRTLMEYSWIFEILPEDID